MKQRTKKLVSMLIVGTMAVSMLAGCGAKKETGSDKSEKKESAKIGVLVADVSGEEAQGFRSYYENYIADNYLIQMRLRVQKMKRQQLRNSHHRDVRRLFLSQAVIVHSR